MKLLMINISNTISDYLIPKLISKGIEVYSAVDDVTALGVMNKISIDVVLIDIDHKKIDFLSFLRTSRKRDAYENLRSVVVSKNLDKALFTKYLSEGLIGVLTKGTDLEEFDSKIIKWIDSKCIYGERRKNLRIKPREKDKFYIRLPITGRTSDKSEAQVIDISIQGIAFKFLNSDDKNYFRANQEVNHAEIDMGNRRLLVTIKLVRVGEVSVGVYVKPREQFTIAVAKHIFERLQEDLPSTS